MAVFFRYFFHFSAWRWDVLVEYLRYTDTTYDEIAVILCPNESLRLIKQRQNIFYI